MRAFVCDRGPRFQVPPEEFPVMWEQFTQWRDRWRERMESFEFFPEGGGFAVVNVADEAELQRMTIEYPFSQHNELEVRPIIDGDASLETWRTVLEKRMAAVR